MVGILNTITLSQDCSDRWRWTLNKEEKFVVKDLSRLVDEKWLQVNGSSQETMWNKLVPNRVNIFVWRALKGRLPVRSELDKRGINLHTLLCPCCDDNVETINHSLLFCNMAWSIWVKIFDWLKGGNVDVFTIGDMFRHNGFRSQSIENREWWQVVTWVTGYFIWKERNNRVFNNKVTSVNKIVQDIQLKSFHWISRRSKNGSWCWQEWLRDPNKSRVNIATTQQ